MTFAITGYDLARYSRGRFILGLGSQVKPHIERRFSMPWSHPAPRMREFVQALRAIWSCWQDGTKLDFQGEFYTHTLMTPFFSPPAHEWGPPPVYLAGVGKLMTEVAGEVCDGFIYHGFTTPSYLREVTLPALLRGRAAGGHDGLDGFDIVGPAFTCVADTEEGLADAIRARSTDRVLRVDARIPRRARPPRLGRPAARAHPHVEGRQVGGDGRPDRRRHGAHLRRRRRRADRRPRAARALGGCGDPPLVLRARTSSTPRCARRCSPN